MPIIAVAIAVAVDAVAVSAAVAGTITALGVIAAVGATISAVGAVTKDKALTIAGGVIGAVGAVGSLASSAGLLGADASAPLFGATPTASTADAASQGSLDAMSGANAGADTAASTADVIPTPPEPPGEVGAVDPATGNVITSPVSGADAAPTAAASTQASAATNAAPSLGTELPAPDQTALANQLALSRTGGTTSTDVVWGDQPSPPTGAAAVNPVPNLPPGALAPGGVAAPGVGGSGVLPSSNPGSLGWSPGAASGADSAANSGIGATLSSALSDIQDFTKNNQLLSYGMMQAAGSLLAGATSTLTPAQVTELKAQAAANNAAAALTQQQTANLAMPKAVASSAPVTGAPQTLVPGASSSAPTPTPGFINQAPVAANVTGKPATAAAA